MHVQQCSGLDQHLVFCRHFGLNDICETQVMVFAPPSCNSIYCMYITQELNHVNQLLMFVGDVANVISGKNWAIYGHQSSLLMKDFTPCWKITTVLGTQCLFATVKGAVTIKAQNGSGSWWSNWDKFEALFIAGVLINSPFLSHFMFYF